MADSVIFLKKGGEGYYEEKKIALSCSGIQNQ